MLIILMHLFDLDLVLIFLLFFMIVPKIMNISKNRNKHPEVFSKMAVWGKILGKQPW